MTAAAKSPKQLTWTDGKTYRCIKSTSPGYNLDKTYKCYTNAKGFKCLMGSDGFEDLCSMLVSDFKEVAE